MAPLISPLLPQLHRDIKLGNVLLDCQNNVKISDFGLAKEVNTMSVAKSFKGTCVFMSPERIEGKDYSYVSDIWSLGICLIMLSTGESPVPVRFTLCLPSKELYE